MNIRGQMHIVIEVETMWSFIFRDAINPSPTRLRTELLTMTPRAAEKAACA